MSKLVYKDPFLEFLRKNVAAYMPQEPGTYVRSMILPEKEGMYRVSVTKYKDGDSHAITDLVTNLASAKKFVADHE